MTRSIIGIVGKKGSGKDTAGEYLIEKYGYVRFAFADKVKEVASALFNFSDEQSMHSLFCSQMQLALVLPSDPMRSDYPRLFPSLRS